MAAGSRQPGRQQQQQRAAVDCGGRRRTSETAVGARRMAVEGGDLRIAVVWMIWYVVAE